MPDAEIFEMGPRDGLQNEKRLIPAAEKIALTKMPDRNGVIRNFVHPRSHMTESIPTLYEAAVGKSHTDPDLPGPRDLHVISVHIKASTGVLAEDTAKREAEAEALCGYVTNQFPASDYVLLCGDLNAETRSEPALVTLTRLFRDDRQPVDQNDDRETNRSRDKPFDYILPNAELSSNHMPTVLNGTIFPDGMVFDSTLWSPPPAPILSDDSYPTGRQHMAIMKTYALHAVPADLGRPGNELAFYDFDDDAGAFRNGAKRTHAGVAGSLYITDDGATTNGAGKSGQGISDSSWKNAGHYYAFTLQIQTGFMAVVTGLQFFARSTGTGPTQWALRSSWDGYGADLATGIQSNDSLWYRQFAQLALSGITTSVTFRIYGTNASSNAGSWMHDNVKVLGSVVARSSDSDGDGLPDAWEIQYGLDPAVSNSSLSNSDTDWMTDLEEYIAGTNPTNGRSCLPAALCAVGSTPDVLAFTIDPSITDRLYRAYACTNIMERPQIWIPWGPELAGNGSNLVLTLTNAAPQLFFRTGVRLP